MRILVESLRRMYLSGKITKEKVENMKILTDAEKQYILRSE